jgi:hypothetical protein
MRPLIARLVPMIVLAVSFLFSFSAPPAAFARQSSGEPRVRFAGVRMSASAVGVDASSRSVNLPTDPRSAVVAAKTNAMDASSPAGRSSVGPSVQAPVLGSGFEAEPDGSPLVSPADPTGAVGTTDVMAAANVHVGVFDRSGTQLVPPQRLRSVAGLSSYSDTDPKVVYDPSDGGWFVLSFIAYTSTQVRIVVMTVPEAQVADTGSWCSTIFNGDQVSGNGQQFSDYDTLGFTDDRVTVATNNFNWQGTKFEYAQVISMRKSQLYDVTCSKPVHLSLFAGGATRNPDGTKGATLQPAVPTEVVAGMPQYLTSFERRNGKGKVVLWRLKETSRGLRLSNVAIKVGPTSTAPWGLQGGGSTSDAHTWWDTGDLRLINASYDPATGFIVTANAVSHDFAPSTRIESAVRWYEVQPAGSLPNSAVTRKGYVGASGDDAGWPSVATDGSGTLFVNYSQASLANDEFLSIHVATVPLGSTAATSALVKAGEARYAFPAPGPQRWGDYSAIERDPAHSAQMFLFNAYALDGGSTTQLWQEWAQVVTDV